MLLKKSGPLSKLALNQGVSNTEELLRNLRDIPYGRTPKKTELAQVWQFHRGTCSSKHALVKAIADEQGWRDVELILCIYKMNATNTPGIKTTLVGTGLSYIPEAHCYIKLRDTSIDITNSDSDIDNIKSDILHEESIEAEQIGAWKEEFHKSYINEWLKSQKIDMSLDELWLVREACISNLSKPQ